MTIQDLHQHQHDPPHRPRSMAGHPPRARVSIVERHQLLVDGLEMALRDDGFDVGAVDVEGRSTDDLVEAALAGQPQLVLLALDLGAGADGTDLIGPLRTAGARVLVITGIEDQARHDRAVALGAEAVLPKTTPLADIRAAVPRAAEGGELMSPAERAACRRRDALAAPARERDLLGLQLLSPRESEVLAALVDGHSVCEIATHGKVRPSTVRAQVRAILVKLGVSSQLQAVAVAHRRGWRAPALGDWEATPTSA